MRRFILISFLSLLVLLAVTLGVGWYLLQDEAFLKSQLSSQTLKYTGRELTVKGPAHLKLGRVTTLEANDIHFANAAWAEQPDMASVGRLQFSIDLSSLFDDQIVFPALSLEDCKVRLVRNDQGEPNWDMGPQSEPVPEPPSPPRDELPVVFRDMQVQNCELYLASLKLEEPLDIKVSGLAMQHLESGRWQSKGSGSVNKEPFSLDGWFAPFHALILGGPLEHDMEISLGDVTAQSSGSVKDAKTLEGANLTTKIQGTDIGKILQEFKLPPFSEGAFDYELKLNTEGKMTKLELDGDLGSVDIKASGELDRLRRPRDGNIQFSIDGPNLGALAKVFGVEGLVEEAFSHVSHAEFKGESIHVKETQLRTDSDHLQIGGHFNTSPGFSGTELDIIFNSDKAGRWTTVFGQPQQKLGALELNSKLAIDSNGLISIDARAEQDTTNLDVKGTLGNFPDSIQPDLEIVFKSSDPSHLAAIVGWELVPATPLTIQGRFGYNGKQIQLGKVHIDLAGDMTDIDGTINLADRYAGSRLNLQMDVKNAGDLGRLFGREDFPEQPLQLGAEVRPEGKGLAFKVTDGNLGDIQLELDGRIPDLEKPLLMDGNFDIDLPRLNDLTILFPKIKLPDAPFSAHGKLKSKDNAVQFDNVIFDLAGDRATINGMLKLENRYAGSDLNAEIDVKSAAALGRLFGQDGLPDEPFKLTAGVKPNGKGMAFEVHDGNLRDLQLDVQGQIADMDYPLVMDASFDIDLPRLSEISFLFPDKSLPEVPFTAKGRLRNQKTRARLDQVQITLDRMKASVDGDLLPDNRFQLAIEASGPDASELDELAGTPFPAKPFTLKTSLAGSPSEFDLKGLNLELGKSRVTGDLKIGLGDVTQIKGKINSPYLDASHWYPGDQTEEETPPASNASKRQWMFDDTPVIVFDDHRLDLDLDLQISKLFLGNTNIDGIKLDLLLSQRLLEIEPFTFKGQQGGSFNGEFSLIGTGNTSKLHLDVKGNNVRIGLSALPEQDPSTYPPLDLELSLDGAGSTNRELASSLDGRYRAYMGSGQVASSGVQLLFSDFLTELINTLNPFAETKKYTQLDCAVLAVDVVSGQVEFIPSIAHTEDITIFSQGAVDLKTEKIDITFNTKPRKGIGLTAGTLINSFIKVGGRLTAPAIEIDPAETIKSGGLAVVTLGISVLAKSASDRFLSSPDPCGDARKELAKRDSAAN